MLEYESDEYYSSENEYENESEVYYNGQGRSRYREAYPAARNGRQYSTQSKALYPKKSRDEWAELSELERNTQMNAQSFAPEEIDEIENTIEAREKGVKNNSKQEQRKPKGRMMPAPIETLTEFNITQYLQNLPSGLTVGQAAHSIPKYRSEMMKAMRRTREQLNQDKEKEANYVGSDEEPTTAAKCTLRIHGKIISAIVDSGAATSIMTKPLMQRLGFKIS